MFDATHAIARLKIAYSIQDTAFALALDPRKFLYVVQHSEDGSYYEKFLMPKKSGGHRNISKPLRGLALAQTRLAAALLTQYKVRPFVKGYVKGSSFVDNAVYHQNQRWILNVDIKDFYPSLGFARVRGLFLSDLFGFSERVSTILARISTFEDGLPQGAKTSPVLANFLAHNLDKKLITIAREERVKYSRYADDITFSSNHRIVPNALVKDHSKKYSHGEIIIGDALSNAFARSGFEINPAKSRIHFRSDRQIVTGLVVNKHANVWRRDVQNLRMKLYSAKKYGLKSAAELWLKSDNESSFRAHVVGWLAHIQQVRGKDDPVLAKLCKSAFEAGISDITWIQETADMVKEFDVFLSHASEDKPKARKLKDRLEASGISVFFDETSIAWGDSIVEKISHGLLKSEYFVPFLTKTFAEKGWTNKELNSAIAMKVNEKGRILPIREENFRVDEEYPLLNETLYKTWPKNEPEEPDFLETICDELMAKIEKAKQ